MLDIPGISQVCKTGDDQDRGRAHGQQLITPKMYHLLPANTRCTLRFFSVWGQFAEKLSGNYIFTNQERTEAQKNET